MDFFITHGIISLNAAPLPQNIFLLIKKKAHFDNLKHIVKAINQITFCSNIMSANMLTQGGGAVFKIWTNLLTYYFNTFLT